jgi:hypothetical protein
MMRHRSKHRTTTPSPVSIGWAIEAQPSHAAAFKTSCAALLHAGFDFGRSFAGRIMYSRDAAGEEYDTPVAVPTGTNMAMCDALRTLNEVAPYFNRSISLGFVYEEGVVPVTCRTYDETGWLAWTLDFEEAAWRKLVAHRRSARDATATLLDVGKTLFTLVPMTYLLIGPSAALADLPRTPTAGLLRRSPVAMVAHRESVGVVQGGVVATTEQVPRGTVVVRQWDLAQPVRSQSVALPKVPPRTQSDPLPNIGRRRG